MKKRYILSAATLFFLSLQLKAQSLPDSLDLYSMSLTELMEIPVTVASKVPLTMRESPSIVTVISAQDIANTGARDLIDVLRLVQGIDVASDVQGVIGIGVRGNWALDGRVLLLLDGMELNELLFSSIQLGHHYPVDQIKRIEIIRGPGSAIYGGNAEYGVINIITKAADGINGVDAKSTLSVNTSGKVMMQNVSVSAGRTAKDWSMGLGVFAGAAQLSDRTYTDPDGNSFNMYDNSARNPMLINGFLKYKGLSVKGFYDAYKTQTQDVFGSITTKPYANNFKTIFLDAQYNWDISSKLTVTPRVNYRRQMPWQLKNGIDSADLENIINYDKSVERILGNIGMQYKHNDNVNITFGSEFYNDNAKSYDDNSLFHNDLKSVSYHNIAFFTQGLFETPWVNVTLGARYDNHSKYDAVFVPRVGLTKVWNKWHAKILYSNAFRAPGIENISLSEQQGIKPEKTTVWEAEAGYQVSDNWVVSANLFDIGTKTPIYYNYLDGAEIYANGKRAGTTGVELESKLKQKNVSLSLNYSFYTAALHSQIETYKVSTDDKSLLAFANHKFVFIGNIRIIKDLNFNFSGVFLGSRYGFVAGSPADAPEKIGGTLLLNTMLRYENLLTKGLSVSLGIHNITNSNPMFIQPYNAGHTPLPAPKTQIQFKLGYNFTN